MDLEKNLTGKGSVGIKDGVFRTVNSEKEILGAVSRKFHIPFDKLAKTLKLKDTDDKDTNFEELDAKFVVESGKINITDSNIVSGSHGYKITGTMGFNGRLNMKGRMIILGKKKTEVKSSSSKKRIDKKLLEDLTGTVKSANLTFFLIDEEGRKYIPFNVRGDISKPSIMVDFDKLVIKQATDRVNRGLKKIGPKGQDILNTLDKLLNH